MILKVELKLKELIPDAELADLPFDRVSADNLNLYAKPG